MKEYKLVITRKYYDAGGSRVAMREAGTLYWLLTDHLGSTSKAANSDGSFNSEQMYKPFGEKRYPTGSPTLPTTYRYTGQRSETGLGPSGGEGLMFYGARWYDSQLGRFLSADSVIPGAGNPQAWDRYAGMMNNPLKYTDPSGHETCDSDGQCGEYRPTNSDINKFSIMYGLSFSGKWRTDYMIAIMIAAITIGSKMAEAINGAVGSDVFRSVFGGLTLYLDPTLKDQKLYGKASTNWIKLRPDKITSRLFGHELGHVFSRRMILGTGNKYADWSSETQIGNGLWDDEGNFMTSGSDRNGGVLGEESGYQCGETVPCQYHYIDELNQTELMDAGSLTSSEQWADMFLNWSLGGLNNTARGVFYTNWINSNMGQWVDDARAR
jgi:RHS repeat-associated protein